jgi:hypothetical protein
MSGPFVFPFLDRVENDISLCAQFSQDMLLIIQEIPDILHVNLRCLLANLITDFSPCDTKDLLLSASFIPVEYLQFTVMNNILQPMRVS